MSVSYLDLKPLLMYLIYLSIAELIWLVDRKLSLINRWHVGWLMILRIDHFHLSQEESVSFEIGNQIRGDYSRHFMNLGLICILFRFFEFRTLIIYHKVHIIVKNSLKHTFLSHNLLFWNLILQKIYKNKWKAKTQITVHFFSDFIKKVKHFPWITVGESKTRSLRILVF